MGRFEGKKVLIVDDEDDVREVIVMNFEMEGFSILEANSGNSAFEIYKDNSFDLIVTDCRMPDGSGVDLIDMINEKGGKIPPIIMISGYSDVSEEEILAKGVKAFVHKPFENQHLFDLIAQYIKVSLV